MEVQVLPERIGQVRRIVSAQLRYWHLDQLIEAVALGVSELLTNVYLHAESDKRCTVDLVWVLDQLTVSVHDGDAREPVPPGSDPLATHGRGLALVAAVSQSWGVRSADGGKTVWFALPAARTAPGAGRGRAPAAARPRPPADGGPARRSAPDRRSPRTPGSPLPAPGTRPPRPADGPEPGRPAALAGARAPAVGGR